MPGQEPLSPNVMLGGTVIVGAVILIVPCEPSHGDSNAARCPRRSPAPGPNRSRPPKAQPHAPPHTPHHRSAETAQHHHTVAVGNQYCSVSRDVTLPYRTSGDRHARPMVLLHGSGSGMASWAETADAFADQWHVYMPDLRRYGDGSWPGTYSFEPMRDDVLAFIAGGAQSHLPQPVLAAMADRIPAGQLVTIPAGHGVHTARPADYQQVVRGFLASN
ncbi:alpha/beta fold hydrolase [Actinocatenispora sera]|uniref:alpha/beta fold hydrolase n=1 Tax=Actinocatenispora sera TaxID=390989 RepID=UPI0033D8C0DB